MSVLYGRSVVKKGDCADSKERGAEELEKAGIMNQERK